ncbi:MAG: 50S ribosomal protein L4 [Thermoplasmata archaeon]|nr:50S ribosomal protein L4 [Thermoplasmata archaeon]
MSSTTAAEPATPVEHVAPHHRVHIVGLDGKAGTHQVTLPLAFSQAVRPDLIRRAVVAAQSHRRQPYGTSLTGGLRHSTRWSGKGKGVSRSPRLMDSMRGAQAPNTVGGRPAHPPRVDRIWTKKINRKESRLAFASALAATRETSLVTARGHDLPDGLHLPLILEDPVENIQTTKEARALLERLQLWPDIQRARDGTQLKSGRARRRGRGRRVPRSVLVVTSLPNRALGFRNLSGVEVVSAQRLATEDLAPGGDPARLTLYSLAALELLRIRLKEPTA